MAHAVRTPSFALRALQGCALSVALLGANAALAQQAPSGLEKAVNAAAKWAAQADAGQADAMWKDSSATMQKSVSQADWAKYIAQVRKEAGAQQGRAWLAVNKVDNPQGMPPGEYLNVVYNTKFANAATFETVSMARNGSSWQPVGYVVRPQQPPKAPAGAPAQPAAGK
jgi:hypothetical protein